MQTHLIHVCFLYEKRATWQFKALQNGLGLFHTHCKRVKEQAVKLDTCSAAVLDGARPSM